MPNKIRGVLVTGASTGIGYDIARLLASRGWRVFAGVRREADGNRVQALAPDRIMAVRLDVTDATSIAAARDLIEAAVGQAGLDGLVNNAGIVVAGPVETVPLDDWRRQFETNVFGVIGVTQAFLPLLRRSRGRVVMIGSISGRISYPLLGPYAASKYALEAVTDALRLELMPDGISVTLIEPGPIKTPIWEKSHAASRLVTQGEAPDLAARYGPLREKLRAVTQKSAAAGLEPAAVSAAVEHALTARRPRIRQVIGRNARLGLLLKFLPDRWSDRLIAASLGIKSSHLRSW
jgi:NAD(P)-dependent dehydrogenase (short-subunit alcohol dehydrogenase family)